MVTSRYFWCLVLVIANQDPKNYWYEVVLEITKILKSDLKHEKILLYVNSKLNTCVSQSIASSTIVRPPPCTTRCIFKVHITYFISDSVAIGRRFNAGSKKEDCTFSSENIHTFSYQNVSKKQPSPPLTHFVFSYIIVHGGGRTMVEDAIDWETHVQLPIHIE